LLLSDRGSVYVKLPVPAENLAHAREVFRQAMSNRLGFGFGTICELEGATCCYTRILQDQTKRLWHQTGGWMSVSCQRDTPRRQGVAVKRRFYWWYLKRRYQVYSHTIEELFG
jgi:hypothetical protein